MTINQFLVITACLGFSLSAAGQSSYQMKSLPIQTRWAKEVNPENALTAYPRPQLVRGNWTNLNGLWEYAVTASNVVKPTAYDGQILVPYPIESALSGVKKALLPSENLWYRRSFSKPVLQAGDRVRLNFGAVDYRATVFVNGTQVGEHEGGYTDFSFDITEALNGDKNEILVKVYDPTDQGLGPHGKQVLNPANIYYTPSSGIWQTVWMEVVPQSYIASLKMTPDLDKGQLNLNVSIPSVGPAHEQKLDGYSIEAEVMDGTKQIARKVGALNGLSAAGAVQALSIKIPNAKLWSPGSPFLYDLVVRFKHKGKVVDQVKSYFGMRKISISKDEKGIERIFLNNKPYFNLGTLDQGFWPDGLYTAPTDEALAFDIKAIKAMGFNTIRKHIKVEPARWYYWADKLGMLVWQDMVNPNQGLPEGSKAAFEAQLKETVSQLHNSPSVVTWVLFNEKWGAYDQQRLTQLIKELDPSRIVNGHSGELLYVNAQLRSPSPDAYVAADMTDVHSYPDPMISIKQAGKAQVVGEFGGIGVFIDNHQWTDDAAWGYIQEKPADLRQKYALMNGKVLAFKAEGLSGSIYTQPFDVETEQNGLLTYDREVIKVPFETLRKIHARLNPDMGTVPEVSAKDADLTDPAILYQRAKEDFARSVQDKAAAKKMIMMAAQNGDIEGKRKYAETFLGMLKAPLTAEDISSVMQFTKSTRDPGYGFMQEHAGDFKRVLGERPFAVKCMNAVYAGEIDALVKSAAKPDWDLIQEKVKPFGIAGDEIFWRAKAIDMFNKQDWSGFVPAAKAYLEKYGDNLSPQDRQSFEAAITQHQ